MSEDQFLARGFVSDIAAELPRFVRDRSSAAFALTDDLSEALLQIALRGAKTTQSSSMSPNALCVSLLFRSVSSLQAAILVIERGMIAEARLLTRSLIENAFCLAAIHANPEEFQRKLRLDDGGARRSILKLALESGALIDKPDVELRIRDALDQISADARVFSVKALAEMGALSRQYIFYRLLSNDSAHPSATSLLRHLEYDRQSGSWSAFKFGPGSADEVGDTLRLMVINGLAVGIAFTDFVQDFDGNARLAELSERSNRLATNPDA